MSERNPCEGCGRCCEDITGYDAEETIQSTFPYAREVSAWEMQNIINGEGGSGVRYLYDGRSPVEGMVIFRIQGVCNNRRSNRECGRHDRCSHASENFQPGSPECNKIRVQAGLKPL